MRVHLSEDSFAAILFEDAIILGAENDTMLMSSKSTPADHMTATAVPFSTLERNSLLFLHPILRQLIRRNLGRRNSMLHSNIQIIYHLR